MTRLLRALRLLNLFSTGIVAGGQLLILRVIMPVKEHWSPRRSLQLHQEMLIDRPLYLRPATTISMVSAVLILLLRRNFSSWSARFLIAGVLATLGVSIPAVRINYPINAAIAALPADSFPEEYPQWRENWDKSHRVRTASGLTALICFILAELAD